MNWRRRDRHTDGGSPSTTARPDATASPKPEPETRESATGATVDLDDALPDTASPIDPKPLPTPDLGPIQTPAPDGPPSTDEAVVIAVTNQKGGVGKTTTTVSLGAALAGEGLDVLVVDLDPQGNATTGLGLRVSQGAPSAYRVIVEQFPIVDAAEPTAVRRLHVVPSSLDLAGAEIELVPQFSRERRLREAVDTIRDQYDVILVDCPPSLGLLTVNALVAADQVLVPIQCEYYALEGLGQLLQTVEMVRSGLNNDLTLGGVLMTMFDGRTNLSQQVVDEVRGHFGDAAYSTVIPRTVRLSEAPSYGQPITEFDPSSRGARAYQRLAREVARRLGLAAPDAPVSPLDALLGASRPQSPGPTSADAPGSSTTDDQSDASDGSSGLSDGESDERPTSLQDLDGEQPSTSAFHVERSRETTEEGPTWQR